MNLTLTGHHIEITPALNEYVQSKLQRITRHFDHVISVNVILSLERLRQCVEATVHLSGHDLHVAVDDADMYAAIDALADKLDRSIVRHKEKLTEGRRHSVDEDAPAND